MQPNMRKQGQPSWVKNSAMLTQAGTKLEQAKDNPNEPNNQKYQN